MKRDLRIYAKKDYPVPFLQGYGRGAASMADLRQDFDEVRGKEKMSRSFYRGISKGTRGY